MVIGYAFYKVVFGSWRLGWGKTISNKDVWNEKYESTAGQTAEKGCTKRWQISDLISTIISGSNSVQNNSIHWSPFQSAVELEEARAMGGRCPGLFPRYLSTDGHSSTDRQGTRSTRVESRAKRVCLCVSRYGFAFIQ